MLVEGLKYLRDGNILTQPNAGQCLNIFKSDCVKSFPVLNTTTLIAYDIEKNDKGAGVHLCHIY